MTPRPTRPATTFALFAAALVASGCGGGSVDTGSVVDREIFIAAYVDLRATALRGSGELTDDQRSAVLTRHGVTEAQLTAFVETYGTDTGFMRDVWNDVEARLDATPSHPDSTRSP